MINGMELAFVFEHHHLVLQISWEINVCFNRSLGLLGNAESFAPWCDPRAIMVQVGKRRSKAYRVPGRTELRPLSEGVHHG
jgi:hypothetical protein